MSRGDSLQSLALFEKMKKLSIDRGMPEGNIERTLASIYLDAGLLNEAEQHFRTSMRLFSNDAWSMYLLADVLIRYDRGIDEGLVLIDKALSKDPQNVFFIWRKGIGLMKKGKYSESLEALEKAKKNFGSITPDMDKDIQKVKDAINSQL
jgi:tetratricopeptide (TPR) repeat protein